MAIKVGRAGKVSDDEIIEAIKSVEEPAASASELAELVGLTRQAVNERLRKLEERGLIESKQFGSGYGWWISQDPDSSR